MPRIRQRPDWMHKVYRYGVVTPLRDPETWPQAMQDESKRLRAFWDLLCAVWQTRTARYRQILQDFPSLRRLQTALELAEQAEDLAYRAWKRARRRDTPEDREAQQALHQAWRTAKADLALVRQALKVERTRLKADLTPHMRDLGVWFRGALKTAYNTGALEEDAETRRHGDQGDDTETRRHGDTGIFPASPRLPLPASLLPYWPNKLRILEEFQHTCDRRLQGRGGDPRPKRGRMTEVHLEWRSVSGGLPVADVLAGANRHVGVRVEEDAETRRRGDAAISPRLLKDAYISLSPTVSLPLRVKLHRLVPKETMVKRVMLLGRERHPRGLWRRRDGTYGVLKAVWDWELQLVLECPPVAPPVHLSTRAAALDLGWRLLEDGDTLRLGVYVDRAGYVPVQALVLPRILLTRWHARRELQERSDKVLEQCKQRVAALLAEAALPTEAQELLAAWSLARAGRLRRLRVVLSQIPRPALPVVEALAVLQAWEAGDALQWRAITQLSRRLVRHRQAVYRQMAQTLCQQYGALAVEEIDWAQLSRTQDDPALAAAAPYRFLVAPGSFGQILRQVAVKYGTRIVAVDPAYTTVTCWHCGSQVVQTGALELECPQGHQWDQDANAARNLYLRAFGEGAE